MKRTVLLLIVIVFGLINAVNAQQRRLDSILTLNNSYHQEDSLKAVYLREVFRAYSSVRNYTKIDLYIDSAILIASRLPGKRTLALTYYRAGGVFHNINKLRAITYYNKSIEIARANNLPKSEASTQLNLGALYMDIMDYPKSLDAHEHALQLFVQLNDEGGMSSCYMNMSSIYVSMGQNVKGMEYIRKALKAFETDESKRGVAVAYDEIAELYFKSTDAELSAMGILPANRFKEIATTLDKGLKAVLKTEDNSLTAVFYSKLGRLNEQQGNLVAAQQNYMKAVDIIGDDSDEESYADNLILAGNFYISKLKEIPKGLGMLHAALVGAKKLGSTGAQEDALMALSNAHEKQRNFDSSLLYYRQAIVVKDSIYSKEKEQEITRRQLKIDFDIKERDYKNAEQLADAKLKQQEQEILLRNQQLQISDKEKTLQRLTFLQKQAELEAKQKLDVSLLNQKDLEKKLATRTRDEKINKQELQISFEQKRTIFLGVMLLLLSGAGFFVYKANRKTGKLNKLVSAQKEELEEMGKVKDKIFSIVSHDMRAPVNNLVAFSSLLGDGEIEQDRLLLYIEQIKGTLDHTSSLMENLLNWAASQMQGFTPMIEEVNITPLIQNVVNGIEQSAYKKNITIQNKVQDDLFMRGDSNMLELITRNLLSNAVKFSRKGSRLEIVAGKNNSDTLLSVKDSGIGLSEAKVKMINGNSIRTLESTNGTDKEKGTGLGLMLCKHFASLMKGSISVESKEGRGSVFTLSLPS